MPGIWNRNGQREACGSGDDDMGRVISNLSLGALLALSYMGSATGQDAGRQQPAAKQPSNVSELLASLDRAAAGLQDYTVNGVTAADGKAQKFKVTFKRPNLVRVDTGSGQVAVQPNGEIKGRLGHGPLARV